MNNTIKDKDLIENIAKGLGMLSQELSRVYDPKHYEIDDNIVFFPDVYNEKYLEWSFLPTNETKRHVWTFDFKTGRITKDIVDDLVHLKDKKCPRCSNPVFKSIVSDYDFQCFFCDEDFYNFEGRY